MSQAASTLASSEVAIPTVAEATRGAVVSGRSAALREDANEARRTGGSNGDGLTLVQVPVPINLTRVKNGARDLKAAMHQHTAVGDELRRCTQKGCTQSTTPKNCTNKGLTRIKSQRSNCSEYNHEGSKDTDGRRGSTLRIKRPGVPLCMTKSNMEASDRQLSEKCSPAAFVMQAGKTTRHLQHTAHRAIGYHHGNNDEEKRFTESDQVSAEEAREHLHLKLLDERLRAIRERRSGHLHRCEEARRQDARAKEDSLHTQHSPKSRSLQHSAAPANGSANLSSAACGDNYAAKRSKEKQRLRGPGIPHRSPLRQFCLRGPAEGGEIGNIHARSFAFLRSYSAGVAWKQQVASHCRDNVSLAQSVREQQGLTCMRHGKPAPTNAPFRSGKYGLAGREQLQHKEKDRLGDTASAVENGYQETAMRLKSITPLGPGILLRKACSYQLERMNRTLSRNLPSLLPIQRRLEEQVERTLSSVDWLEQRVAHLTQLLCLHLAELPVSAADLGGKRSKARVDTKQI